MNVSTKFKMFQPGPQCWINRIILQLKKQQALLHIYKFHCIFHKLYFRAELEPYCTS